MSQISFSVRLNIVSSDDELEAALLGLADGVWSANLAKNVHYDIVERQKSAPDFATYYMRPGQAPMSLAGNAPMAYCSGVYVPGHKAYFFTGGGHDDWCGSEVAKLDLRTLTWVRTDDSAKYTSDGTEDPSVPFQSSDSPSKGLPGRRAWRNPAGRFAPTATHMYGGMCYLPGIDKIFVQGAAPFQSGMGSPGGSTFIDPSSGHWDESGAIPGGHLGTDCMTNRVPLVRVVNSSLVPTGETLTDCVFRNVSQDTLLVDVSNKRYQRTVRYYGGAFNRKANGCIARDPVTPGSLAYVQDRDAASFRYAPRVDIMRNDGQPHANIEVFPYGNAKPAEIPADGTPSRWIYMGDYIPGCTKIAVFVGGVGLYALDTTDWTWSAQIVAMPYGDTTIMGLFKRVEFFSDYDCFGYVSGSSLHVLRRPAVFS